MDNILNAKKVNKEYLCLRLITFIRYFGDCLFYAYFYLFLKNRGLNESEIGMVCAITPLIALMVNPLWNFLSKDVNKNKKIMQIITVLEGIFIIVFTRCSLIETLALMTALTAFVGSPFYTLLDGYSGVYANIYQKDYTKIRFVGTLAYTLSTLFASMLLFLTKNNFNVLFYISGTIFISVSVLLTLIRPIDLSNHNEKEVKRDFRLVLKNKTFWFFLIIYLFTYAVSYTTDSYTSLYFTEHLHIKAYSWGYIHAGILFTEFITMLIISKFNLQKYYSLGWVIFALLCTIRFFIFFIDVSLPFAIVIAFFRGLGFGLFLAISIPTIERICGLGNVTAGLFILALSSAVIQGIANFSFGNIIYQIGYPAFFGIVSLFTFMAMIICLIYFIFHKFEFPKHK